MSAVLDYEAICARDGAAFTLRFQGADKVVDVRMTGAVVARLFTRWLFGPDREGVLVLPLSPLGERCTWKGGPDGDEEFEGAPGGVQIRVVSRDDDVEIEIAGRLGPEELHLDPACAGLADGRPTDGKEGEPDGCPVREADGDHDVGVVGGHDDVSEIEGRREKAESPPAGSRHAPTLRNAGGIA
ncbi:hypothetical protein [Brevundimonas sp. DWR2-3-1b1]|uniref:hypothetical protein n=1 Tax=unclassified Brevundimonas TaxID=2622653 RepID=UPI003CEB9C39